MEFNSKLNTICESLLSGSQLIQFQVKSLEKQLNLSYFRSSSLRI
jgi:hypothetical protein